MTDEYARTLFLRFPWHSNLEIQSFRLDDRLARGPRSPIFQARMNVDRDIVSSCREVSPKSSKKRPRSSCSRKIFLYDKPPVHHIVVRPGYSMHNGRRISPDGATSRAKSTDSLSHLWASLSAGVEPSGRRLWNRAPCAFRIMCSAMPHTRDRHHFHNNGTLRRADTAGGRCNRIAAQ